MDPQRRPVKWRREISVDLYRVPRKREKNGEAAMSEQLSPGNPGLAMHVDGSGSNTDYQQLGPSATTAEAQRIASFLPLCCVQSTKLTPTSPDIGGKPSLAKLCSFSDGF